MGVDVLSERAAMMREALQKSQSITDTMVSTLGSFDHRLSALETAMRPTQVFYFPFLGFCFINFPLCLVAEKLLGNLRLKESPNLIHYFGSTLGW